MSLSKLTCRPTHNIAHNQKVAYVASAVRRSPNPPKLTIRFCFFLLLFSPPTSSLSPFPTSFSPPLPFLHLLSSLITFYFFVARLRSPDEMDMNHLIGSVIYGSWLDAGFVRLGWS